MHYRSLDELRRDLKRSGSDVQIAEDAPAAGAACTPVSPKPTKTEAQRELERARREQLQRRFYTLWTQMGGQDLDPEYCFHPVRGWRSDFVRRLCGVLIEIEGGTRINGRHNRHKGFREDAEKYNAAALLGFRLFRFTSDMITPAHLRPVIELIDRLEREADGQRQSLR